MSAGVLTEEQLAGALELLSHGVRIGEALVQLGIVTEDGAKISWRTANDSIHKTV